MEQEIWKDIRGYEGKYRVSNQGRFLRLRHEIRDEMKHTIRKRILEEMIIKSHPVLRKNRPKEVDNKYQRVCLGKDGVSKFYSIHQLVAKHFIPNPENKPQVNHKNGIKDDNRVENLEWVTGKENQAHAIITGLKTDEAISIPVRVFKNGLLFGEFKSIEKATKVVGVSWP